MTDVTTMLAARATAGSRYSDAVDELKAAYVDLAALENALLNLSHGVGQPQRDTISTSRFPVSHVNELPHELRHPIYSAGGQGSWADEIATAEADYVNDLIAG